MNVETFLHNSLINSRDFFSCDYTSARLKFLSAVENLKLPHSKQSWHLNSELCCDTVWIGPSNANNLLVMISGTHGVEGYCGSAVQSFIVEGVINGFFKIPDDCAILLIHALNPWGMHYYRRCDQEGIDLNRNFIDFNQTLIENSEFTNYLEQLASVESSVRFEKFKQLANEVGQQLFDEQFSGGQYHCNWGPFYGGQQPSWSNQVIESIIKEYKLSDKLLVVLDVHSGLGPFGFGELISDHTPDTAGFEFAEKLFGPAAAQTLLGDSFSVTKRGLLDYRWHKLMQKQGCFLTLEFGSYGTAALFKVILDDHIAWRGEKGVSKEELNLQAQKMLQHFCPEQHMWQQAVLFKSWQVVEQIFVAFSENSDYSEFQNGKS
ncbi:MAG: DUF2817 domain-containing protein [Gammaproteobacteria bacterium]|nr:DUF2817 domain-containing protein [Gammaproteobacteria bacterium]